MYSDPIFSENKDNYLDNSCLLFLPEPYPNFYEYDECIDPKMNLSLILILKKMKILIQLLFYQKKLKES